MRRRQRFVFVRVGYATRGGQDRSAAGGKRRSVGRRGHAWPGGQGRGQSRHDACRAPRVGRPGSDVAVPRSRCGGRRRERSAPCGHGPGGRVTGDARGRERGRPAAIGRRSAWFSAALLHCPLGVITHLLRSCARDACLPFISFLYIIISFKVMEKT